MHYEFEDYRIKNIKDPGPWLTWAVPNELVMKYLFRLLLWMFFLPWVLFGGTLAPLGILLQFLVVDYFSWLKYKNTNSI